VNPRELLETLTYGGFQRLLASPLMLAVAWSELNKSYRKEKFAAASQKLVPEVRAEDLQKSYAGIRAQLVSEDGELVKDPLFVERARTPFTSSTPSPRAHLLAAVRRPHRGAARGKGVSAATSVPLLPVAPPNLMV